jgi:hypothetical protein
MFNQIGFEFEKQSEKLLNPNINMLRIHIYVASLNRKWFSIVESDNKKSN